MGRKKTEAPAPLPPRVWTTVRREVVAEFPDTGGLYTRAHASAIVRQDSVELEVRGAVLNLGLGYGTASAPRNLELPSELWDDFVAQIDTQRKLVRGD